LQSKSADHRWSHFSIVRLVEPDHALRRPVHELSATPTCLPGFNLVKTNSGKQPLEVAKAKRATAIPKRMLQLVYLRHSGLPSVTES
jgi:hypothetical protein